MIKIPKHIHFKFLETRAHFFGNSIKLFIAAMIRFYILKSNKKSWIHSVIVYVSFLKAQRKIIFKQNLWTRFLWRIVFISFLSFSVRLKSRHRSMLKHSRSCSRFDTNHKLGRKGTTNAVRNRTN